MSDELAPLGSGPIRWPTPGDTLFTSSGPNDAVLKPAFGSNMHMMTAGYRRAADALVDQAAGWQYDRDSLVWPIVFLYRQYLELALKVAIADFGRSASIEPNWRSHDLKFLWSQFKKITHYWGIEKNDKMNSTVGKVIAEFSNVDPESMSFRYPVTHEGDPIDLAGHERLDLIRIKDVMRGVANLLDSTTGWISDLEKSGDDDGPEYDGPEY